MKYEDWIPVTERLPESNKKVLCCLGRGGFCIAEYREHEGWYRLNHNVHEINPTAWAYLPEPYKEK